MDIEEATSIIKCIPAIYRHRGYYDKDGKWFEGEGNLLTEKEITAIETILSELDKDNNIISDLQNEVTLKQCELDKKDNIINDMDIQEAKEAYKDLKKNAFIVESIDKNFFLKFAETILSELEKKNKIIDEIKNDLKEHIKFCKQEASGSLNNEICHISLKFDKSLLDIIESRG